MFFFGFLYSVIPLTIVLGMVVVAVRAVVIFVVPPRRCVKEASCEKCKYPVAGLSTWTCPECGSHLLSVGIVTRAMEMRRRGGYFSAIGGLFFLLLIASLIGMGVALGTLGESAGVMGGGVSVQTNILTETSGAIPPLKLTVEQDWSSGVGAKIMMTGTSSVLDELVMYEGPPATFRRTDGTGTAAEGDLSEEVLKDWLSDGGIEVASAEAQRAIKELHDCAMSGGLSIGLQTGSGDLPSFAIGNPTFTTKPQPGQEASYSQFVMVMWAIPASGLLLLILFTLLIIRRRRKLLREADATVPTPMPVPPA